MSPSSQSDELSRAILTACRLEPLAAITPGHSQRAAYGVDTDHAWFDSLRAIEPGLESNPDQVSIPDSECLPAECTPEVEEPVDSAKDDGENAMTKKDNPCPPEDHRYVWLRTCLAIGWALGLVAGSALTVHRAPSPKTYDGMFLTVICGLAALGLLHRQVLPLIKEGSAFATRFPSWWALAIGSMAGLTGRIVAVTLANSGEVDELINTAISWVIVTIGMATQ